MDQFNGILERLQKLENREQYIGKYEDVYKNVDDLKKKFPDVEKDVAVIRTRFDSLEEKIDYRFDMVNERFNTQERVINERFNTQDVKFTEMDKRLDFQSKLLIAILVAILGMFATLIIFLFSITKII